MKAVHDRQFDGVKVGGIAKQRAVTKMHNCEGSSA